MDSFRSLLYGLLNNNHYSDLVGRDTVGKYTIDTCYTMDQGYETAVWKDNGEIVIVARYSNKDEALNGHQFWKDKCLDNPSYAWSVQMDSYIMF